MLSKEELSKEVYITSPQPLTLLWDSVEHEVGDKPIVIKRGVAEHWRGLGYEINVSDVPMAEIEKRKIVNPLDAESKGEAFQGIKKRGPRGG